ncbi:MAG: hypothetical protein ACN4GZ_20370, partial [Acidimicrobiales bacterium]
MSVPLHFVRSLVALGLLLGACTSGDQTVLDDGRNDSSERQVAQEGDRQGDVDPDARQSPEVPTIDLATHTAFSRVIVRGAEPGA